MRRFVLLAALPLAGLAFTAALTGLWDPDSFHHLAMGRALARGDSFAHDPLLFTVADLPSGRPPYWLASLIFHLASIPAGPAGGPILVGLVFAALALILLLDGLDGAPAEAGPWAVLLPAAAVLLVLPELRIRSAPRPEAFGFLLLAVTLLAVRRHEQGRPRLLMAFPVLALAWHQLHVTVVMGLGVVALHLAWLVARHAAARRRPGSAAPPALGLPAAVLALGLLAGALSPAPFAQLEVGTRFLASLLGQVAPGSDLAGVITHLRLTIEELRPTAAGDWLRPFGPLVIAAALATALRRAPGWGRELATILAFGAFAAEGIRFAPVAALVAAPIAARNLGELLSRVAARWPRRGRVLAAILAAAAVVRAGTAPTLALQPISLSAVPGAFPERAAAVLAELRFDGRLYNDLGDGGYLEWRLDRPVFQDGRGLVRREDAADLTTVPLQPAAMARLDARWGFEALVLSTAPPAGADEPQLQRVAAAWAAVADPARWALVALDDGGALYLRRDGRFAAWAARAEFRLLRPGLQLPVQAFLGPFTAAYAGELARAAREAPRCVACRIGLAGLLVEQGRLDEARPVLAELDGLVPPWSRATVALLRAAAAERGGELAEAEGHYRQALRLGAPAGPVRRALAQLLLLAGREADASAVLRANLEEAPQTADLLLAAHLARRRGDTAAAAPLEAAAEASARRDAARARLGEGYALAADGRAEEARRAYLEALAGDPGSEAPLRALGALDLGLGRAGASAASFRRATELAPDSPDAWYGLGCALQLGGDGPGAEAALRRALRLRPQGNQAVDIQRRLDELGRRAAGPPPAGRR